MASKLERHAEPLSALGHPVRLAILPRRMEDSTYRVDAGEGAPDERAAAGQPGERPPPASSGLVDLRGVFVLLVEDNSLVSETFRDWLEHCGAVLYVADSAQTAMDVLQRCQPTVVVSDIGLPDEDGYALMRCIRNLSDESLRNVPAIAVTAYVRDIDRRAALQAGFNLHLAKPVELSVLASAILDVVMTSAVSSPA